METVNEVNRDRNLVKISLTDWDGATFVIANFVGSRAELTDRLTLKLEWLVSAKRALDLTIKEKIDAKNNAVDESVNEDSIDEVDLSLEPNYVDEGDVNVGNEDGE